jgi:hypothetical protein
VAHVVLTASDAAPGDAFGRSVAISGDTIIVGAPGDDERGENAGAAYVFVRDATRAWVEKQKLLPAEGIAGDFFGWSVAVDGDLAVVGAPRDHRGANGQPDPSLSDRGAAYVFGRFGGTWRQLTRLQPSHVAGGDQYGWAVAASGDTIAVSAPFRDFSGASPVVADAGLVAVYRTMDWLEWYAEAEWDGMCCSLGFSLALHENHLAIGLPGPHSLSMSYWRRGATWVHAWNSRTFRDGPGELADFAGPTGVALDIDGSLLALDGNSVRRLTLAGDVTTLFSTVGETRAFYRRTVSGMTVDSKGRIWTAERVQSCPRWCWDVDGELRRYARDGTSTVVATGLTFIGSLAADEVGGVFAIVGNAAGSVVQVSESGTVRTVTSTVSQVTSLTAAPGGALWVVDGSDLRRVTLATGATQTVALLGYPDNRVAADTDGSIWVASKGPSPGTVVRRVEGDQVGPVIAGRSTADCTRPIDGTGEQACLVNATALAATADGRLALVDGSRIRLVSASGEVRTLAGRDELDVSDPSFGYAVAVRHGRVLRGAPRAPLSLTPLERVGAATEATEETSGTPDGAYSFISVRQADAFARYGAAVAFAGSRAIALGPANGCLWLGPSSCVDDTAGRPEASRSTRFGCSGSSTMGAGDSRRRCPYQTSRHALGTGLLSPRTARGWWPAPPSGTTARRSRRPTGTSSARGACSSTTSRRSTPTATRCPTTGRPPSASIRPIPPTRRWTPIVTG